MTNLKVADRFELQAEYSKDIFVARDEFPGLTCDHECQRVVFVKGSFTKECMAVEEEVYKLLGHTAGFPGLRWSGDWDGMYWIVLATFTAYTPTSRIFSTHKM